MIAFSNEEWINRFSGDIPLLDIFDALDRQVAIELMYGIQSPLAPVTK